MSERLREHITFTEGTCRCGCGLQASDETLDWINEVIERCGFPIWLSTTARCITFNTIIGGVADSPHLLTEDSNGAVDYIMRGPMRRGKLLEVIMDMRKEGTINHVEICDQHIHAGKVPKNHRLAGLVNVGRSK